MSLSDGLAVRLGPVAAALPPGRAVHGGEGTDENPALWVSDGPVTADLVRSLRAGQRHTGLCPLLLDSLTRDGDGARRPWDDGELRPADMTSPQRHDPDALLRRWWQTSTAADADAARPWPGLAEAAVSSVDADEHADRCTSDLLRSRPHLRLGLVASGRASDAVTAAGWTGPVNHTNDTAEISAVLRSWEDRFGARVIGAGYAELFVSVAGPPGGLTHATRLAAEHFAFCPDNIWQGSGTLTDYAHRLIDAPMWHFWWD